MWFSIVGDVGGSYKSESETFGGVTVSADVKLHTVQGGVRVRAAMMNPRVVPLGQVLFGFGHASASASGGGINISDSATEPMMSASGGVDVSGGGSAGVRVLVGWMRDFPDGGGGSNAFTLSVGARVGF